MRGLNWRRVRVADVEQKLVIRQCGFIFLLGSATGKLSSNPQRAGKNWHRVTVVNVNPEVGNNTRTLP